MMPPVSLGQVVVTPGTIDEIVADARRMIEAGEKCACIPLNLSKYVLAKKDAKLARAIRECGLVIADGVPITWLARRVGHSGVRRITGVEFVERLLADAADRGWGVYFLGAKEEVLREACVRLEARFPGLRIAGRRNGYFAEADIPGILADVNASGARLLLLGLGLPQKEYFVFDHFDCLDPPFCVTVGGAFDIWSGSKKRAPILIQRLGLEWLYRSLYDPSRAQLIVRYGLSFARDLVFLPRQETGGGSR